jgi:hypothetical protein
METFREASRRIGACEDSLAPGKPTVAAGTLLSNSCREDVANRDRKVADLGPASVSERTIYRITTLICGNHWIQYDIQHLSDMQPQSVFVHKALPSFNILSI